MNSLRCTFISCQEGKGMGWMDLLKEDIVDNSPFFQVMGKDYLLFEWQGKIVLTKNIQRLLDLAAQGVTIYTPMNTLAMKLLKKPLLQDMVLLIDIKELQKKGWKMPTIGIYPVAGKI
jgi:hypothetical protein